MHGTSIYVSQLEVGDCIMPFRNAGVCNRVKSLVRGYSDGGDEGYIVEFADGFVEFLNCAEKVIIALQS